MEDLFEISTQDRYNQLLLENKKLKEENLQLKKQIELYKNKNYEKNESEPLIFHKTKTENIVLTPEEKIKIFMNLFKCRGDVYAVRWENKKKESGYSPVCLNEWKSGLCQKPQIKCMKCSNKKYANLDEKVIESHLKGEIVVGIYPLCLDETCNFLAIDFD
ncbi:MAG TPA: helicase, partial [Spirochaetota bacterium]|nr:helicase [Spirochaetota bacterium]